MPSNSGNSAGRSDTFCPLFCLHVGRFRKGCNLGIETELAMWNSTSCLLEYGKRHALNPPSRPHRNCNFLVAHLIAPLRPPAGGPKDHIEVTALHDAAHSAVITRHLQTTTARGDSKPLTYMPTTNRGAEQVEEERAAAGQQQRQAAAVRRLTAGSPRGRCGQCGGFRPRPPLGAATSSSMRGPVSLIRCREPPSFCPSSLSLFWCL